MSCRSGATTRPILLAEPCPPATFCPKKRRPKRCPRCCPSCSGPRSTECLDRGRLRVSTALCGSFEAGQRVGGSRDEQPPKHGLNQPAPPAWRELERSLVRDATPLRADRRDANDLVVGDAKREADVEREPMRSYGFPHEKRHPQSM